MNPGDIFLLKDHELRFGPPKDTLFIYIGEIDEIVIIILAIKTTSQVQHYQPGASRHKNAIIQYQPGTHGFEKETIIDLTEKVYEIELEKVDTGKIIGSIPKQDIAKIFNSMMHSSKYPAKMIKDLYNDLTAHGIPGIKKPK